MLINRLKTLTPLQTVQLVSATILGCVCAYLSLLVIMQLYKADDQFIPVVRAPSANVVYWNWFLGESEIADAASDQLDDLADAKINATLLGVMIAGESSSATLKFNGKPEAVYHTGDDLGLNSSIVKIQPYRIVVKENGVNKQVLMKKPDAVMVTEESEDGRQPQSDGFALANMFGAVPVNVGGNSGLKMNNLSDELKILADIQEGDVVVKVDGLSVQSLMGNPTKWMRYSASSSLPVTVIRQGQEETIYVNAASLSAKMLPKLGLKQ